MSNAIDWFINESILSGSGGGLRILGGVSEFLLGHFHEMLNTFLEYSAQAQSIGTLVGDLIKGGSGCLVTEVHGMLPSRPRGCVQAIYQELIPNLQFTHCITHKLHD